MLTNSAVVNLTQFRYLYVPNAIVILLILYLTDRCLGQFKKQKFIVCIFLAIVLILNIYTTRAYGISVLSKQLFPLNKMLSNIEVGLKTGQITKENRLYIQDDIVKRLPSICWNKEMGICCMRGSYQWLFSKEEIKCFSSFEYAKWVINEKDFSIANK